ncbi:MAG: Hsp20/alpha crystallin family protein [Patescibacteria group bacterium]|nr:Hsp20/alpha crystallin family protein [Patescibacteria group bacterium]
MALIKYRPFWPDFDEDFFKLPSEMGNFTPAVDVYEEKDNVIVESPLAGIDPEKVDIEIEDNVLKISGQQEKETEVEEKDYYRKEVRSGSFYRSVPLPKAVDGPKAEAEFKDGMLKITVPKREEAKPKKIKVKAKKE